MALGQVKKRQEVALDSLERLMSYARESPSNSLQKCVLHHVVLLKFTPPLFATSADMDKQGAELVLYLRGDAAPREEGSSL